VFDGPRPAFHTLEGNWTLSEDGLDLGDGQPAHAFAAVGQLRLETSGGVAVLRRVPFE
jgi:hypothetical protein